VVVELRVENYVPEMNLPVHVSYYYSSFFNYHKILLFVLGEGGGAGASEG
jgi:hypothetical protein